jgi:hypothetical protein
MVRMKIATNNPALAELQFQLAKLGQGSLPMTEKAMKTGASLIQQRWIDFANGAPLRGVAEPLKNPTGGYARSIHAKQTGTFEHEIYSETQIADWIDNGTDDLDMTKTHPFGPRSRVSQKTGYSYLIVPFRWGTPGAVGFKNVMPIDVYNIARKFKKMETTRSAASAPDSDKTPNARGQMVGRAKYNKGYGRLNVGGIAGTLEQKLRMRGMVRTTDSTGKNRSGGYLTFRIISANPEAKGGPKNWVREGLPARHVTRAVAAETQPAIDAMVENSIREDLGL